MKYKHLLQNMLLTLILSIAGLHYGPDYISFSRNEATNWTEGRVAQGEEIFALSRESIGTMADCLDRANLPRNTLDGLRFRLHADGLVEGLLLLNQKELIRNGDHHSYEFMISSFILNREDGEIINKIDTKLTLDLSVEHPADSPRTIENDQAQWASFTNLMLTHKMMFYHEDPNRPDWIMLLTAFPGFDPESRTFIKFMQPEDVSPDVYKTTTGWNLHATGDPEIDDQSFVLSSNRDAQASAVLDNYHTLATQAFSTEAYSLLRELGGDDMWGWGLVSELSTQIPVYIFMNTPEKDKIRTTSENEEEVEFVNNSGISPGIKRGKLVLAPDGPEGYYTLSISFGSGDPRIIDLGNPAMEPEEINAKVERIYALLFASAVDPAESEADSPR